MIEKFKDFKFKFEEQRKAYSDPNNVLSTKEKYGLLEEIQRESIWNYLQLAVEVLFDLASDKDEYLNHLENIFLKVKVDRGSGLFFKMFIKIGEEKPKIAIMLYDKIQSYTKNIDFKITSGLILGSYSFSNQDRLVNLIKENSGYPMKNTILKAILVRYEKEKLPPNIREYLDKSELLTDEEVLTELMNIYLSLYNNEKDYFYGKIKSLAKRKIIPVNRLLFWRIIGARLDKFHTLELIELCKDSDEDIVSNMIYPLTDYPEEVERVSKLIIYWINKNLEFKIPHFDWAIQELTKKNKKFIEYFLENYDKVKTEKLGYVYIFPRIFENMASQDVEFAIEKIIKKKIDEIEEKLFYELISKIIGIIYNKDKEKMFVLLLPLAQRVEGIAEKKEFINENKSSFDNFVKGKNFDRLIDYTDDLLTQLKFRIIDFEYEQIDENLKTFSELYNLSKNNLKELNDKKRFSSLFWLGNWKRDKELKKSYLNEIEVFLKSSKRIPNQRNGDNTKSLIDDLGNEKEFWNDFSEFIFSNRFLKRQDCELILEPKIPNKVNYADLFTKLDSRNIFFEVTNSNGDRSLHLDNGAVGIKNKVNNILADKSSQLYSQKTFEEMEKGVRKDLFFIVIDASSSVIDEYMIANSFFGTLAYQFYRNNETGETTNGDWIRQDDAIVKNKKVVSGLVYFKKRLVNVDGQIKFLLEGDIISNPYAVNQPTEEEIKKLKKIIFEK
jgi:hypothetical protein